MKNYSPHEKIMGIIRFLMGWIFLWPFLDKLLGLGFTTERASAWIHGGSPTNGFLAFGTKGPFAEFFQGLAGYAHIDWIFMLSLALIGVALMLGIFTRIAAYSGALLLFLMWLAVLPPEHNPFLDEHIIYALTLIATTMMPSDFCGIGRSWKRRPLVRSHKILQ